MIFLFESQLWLLSTRIKIMAMWLNLNEYFKGIRPYFFSHEIELDQKQSLLNIDFNLRFFILKKAQCVVQNVLCHNHHFRWDLLIGRWLCHRGQLTFANEWPTMTRTRAKPISFWHSTNLQKNVHSIYLWNFTIMFCFCVCWSLSNRWHDCLTMINKHKSRI